MSQQRLLSLPTALGAVFFLGIGLWAFADASSFFDEVADFPPYNAHFIHDVGAFQAGLGAVLLLAILFPRDALLVALGGVGFGAALHVATHIRDHDLGAIPTRSSWASWRCSCWPAPHGGWHLRCTTRAAFVD